MAASTASSTSGKPATRKAAKANMGQKKETQARKRRRDSAATTASTTKRSDVDDENDSDAEQLLAKVTTDTRKRTSKRKKTTILEEFTSLDALLNNDFEEKRKKQLRENKLQKLRDEATTVTTVESSLLTKIMNDMATNMSSLNADNHLFSAELPHSQEKFGYVFTPITEELSSGLPSACFTHMIQGYRSVFGEKAPNIRMEWQPSVYDFLNAFRTFGFQDSKRSMSAKSKIHAPPKVKKKNVLPFPALNMQYALMYLILCLRSKTLKLDGYDAFSFTMFFLRMQFEKDMHPEIVQLASICIEELLDVFPLVEWRKEWAPSLVLRIAGVNEGLFDSASGWLNVARHLPRTTRGTQLTTGLAIYVLQHRIDKDPQDGSNSERPLKFPIQSGLVLDIVAGIIDDLTMKYTEKRKDSKASKSAPPYDLLCKKVALMDLALQAFLNILTQKQMSIMLKKLDDLTGAHKSTMSAKWHELKTLVSLMHRKYSLENLRIGRDSSPTAKTVLFIDDTNTS